MTDFTNQKPLGARTEGLLYAVDVVFCIDITGSMGPAIDRVKQSALQFHDDLARELLTKDKGVQQLRVRCIGYRDFGCDGDYSIEATQFLTLPNQALEFHEFVSQLSAKGGGDEPESGLEALTLAIRSAWERGLDRRRHIIVLFTDASAHRLGTHPVPPKYGVMPSGLAQLADMWGDEEVEGEMEFSAKRLLLYAPDAYPWNEIGTAWENVIHFPSRAGAGLRDHEMKQILDAIAGSV